ncbi:MAG: hypothetical protein KDB23_07295 [Planctomycetales bacterium]|nr:hypothetical protein [Planctomycetales bacterium]
MTIRRTQRSIRRFLQLTFVGSTVCAAALTAQASQWTGAVDSDFFNSGNWDNGVPLSLDDLAEIEGGNSFPIQIGQVDEQVEIGAIRIGVDSGGGSIEQLGRTLVLDGEGIGQESAIGIAAAESSTWVMRNNAVILYDNPIVDGGIGLDTSGADLDFDLGKSLPDGAMGTLELHDSSALRISDDLKMADGGGFATVIMDGLSQITIGSGVSVSGTSLLDISGNAMFVTGNSAAPGDSIHGRTNEGYLTLSTIDSETATVNISDNGKLYARTLQQRGGISNVTLHDDGELAVFEVFENAAPSLGNATVAGSAQGPQRTSHVSANAGSETVIELFDRAKFSVDSALEDSGWSGLVLSGGTNRGGNSAGGTTMISVHDQASFQIAHDLHMTLGNGEDANSVLQVFGPDATVTIGGDLRMALNEFDEENPGSATIESIITGPTQATIDVDGAAKIDYGTLVVNFNGYTPTGGESYVLLNASTIEGTFRETLLPSLPNRMSWDLQITGTQVLLTVMTSADFNGNGVLDAADIDLLSAQVRSGVFDAQYDLNDDGTVDGLDRDVWVNEIKRTYYGDATMDGKFDSGDLVEVFQAGQYEDGIVGNSTWATGDWNGDTEFDSSDFVTAFSAGGYEAGPRAAVSAVPEPASWVLALLGLLGLRRRR